MRALKHFCENRSINLNENSDIAKIKKEIQLEFKMSEGGVITIDNIHYDLDFLISQLNDPAVLDKLIFLENIKQIRWLNDYLNHDLLNFRHKSQAIPKEYDSPEFRAFLSPIFAESFRKSMIKLFNYSRFDDISTLLNYSFYILDESIEYAFDPVKNWLQEGIVLFRNVNRSNMLSKRSDIEKWTQPFLGVVLDRVPDFYQKQKEDLIEEVMAFLKDICQIDVVLTYKIGFQISKVDSIRIDLREYTKNSFGVIKSNYDSLVRDRNGEGSKSAPEFSAKTLVYIVLIILKLTIILASLAR